MKLLKARLYQVRNYQDEFFSFDPNINLIIGKNAQGKTNLLEAVYLACTGKPFRTSRTKDMISFGKERMELRLIFESFGKEKDFRYQLDKKSHLFHINQVSFSSRAELFGNFPMVLFSPDHLKMVREGPSERRDFLDREISFLSKTYFYKLLRYQKLLSERNALLRSERVDETLLSVYDEGMSEANAFLFEKRKDFLQKLAEVAKETHRKISSGREELALSYESDGFSEFSLSERLKRKRSQELRMRTTTEGIHLDDFRVELNGIDVRRFGSQGQQRSAALSIFLSLIPFIESQTKESPIILLDDVFSELDELRQEQILEHVQNHQVLISTTDVGKIQLPANLIEIEAGKNVGGYFG
ncbi:DNA replication/repair protein RecF [Guggenheimella bovis]